MANTGRERRPHSLSHVLLTAGGTRSIRGTLPSASTRARRALSSIRRADDVPPGCPRWLCGAQNAQQRNSRIRPAFFGPMPRTSARVAASTVRMRSTEPKWQRSRCARAGPTPGSPCNRKSRLDARRFGFRDARCRLHRRCAVQPPLLVTLLLGGEAQVRGQVIPQTSNHIASALDAPPLNLQPTSNDSQGVRFGDGWSDPSTLHGPPWLTRFSETTRPRASCDFPTKCRYISSPNTASSWS